MQVFLDGPAEETLERGKEMETGREKEKRKQRRERREGRVNEEKGAKLQEKNMKTDTKGIQ